MNKQISILILAVSALWLGLSLSAHAGSSSPSGCTDLSGIAEIPAVDFEDDIQPLLDNCLGCHGPNNQQAGLDLSSGESYDNLVGVFSTTAPARMRAEPFNADDSVLFLATNCTNPGGPSFLMGDLDEEDRALIRDWINQGAWAEPTEPAIPSDVGLTQVFAANTFSGALGLVHAGDGSNRLFVIRQSGVIEAIDENDATTTFMNISGRLTSGGERGLLGLAFHPDFATNGRFFVNYSAGNGHPSGASSGDTVVSEFTIDGSGNGDPTSEQVLMTVHQDFANHNGGHIAFGPDGYLYIGMGDGGSGGDPCDRAQTLDPANLNTQPSGCSNPADSAALLGKMLRIDVDNTTPEGSNNLCAANPDGSAEYAIPADNPWADDPSICAETWSYGLRNPWRWSFDRLTGDLWIADVGQREWEEVNLELADHPGGADYGWNHCEASYTYPEQDPPELCQFEHEFPVLEYPISDQSECAITGGYRYRGPVTSLQGTYIYGDYCSGRIWFASQVGPGEFEDLEFSVEGFDLRSFGEDELGHLYVVRSGGIWRFEGDEPPAPEISAIDPDSGPSAGGTTITVSGDHFVAGATVTLGSDACQNVDFISASELNCQTPGGPDGSVDVTVTNPDDQSVTLVNGFTYLAAPVVATVSPNEGPDTGGTLITIGGDFFRDGAEVNVGGQDCPVESIAPQTITCTTPPGEEGNVNVTVTNPDGQSATLSDGFSYLLDLYFSDRFESP